MYSEALAVLDKNTELYMIDQLEKKIKKKDAAISKKDAVISIKDAEIDRLKAKLAQYENPSEE